MAVYYTGGGGSLLGSLLGLGATFIPGLQPAAPFLGAAGALMNGDPVGAATSMIGGIPGLQAAAPYIGAAGALANGNPAGAAASLAGGLMNAAKPGPAPQGDSLQNALQNAARKTYQDPWMNPESDEWHKWETWGTRGNPAVNSMVESLAQELPYAAYQSGDLTDAAGREQGGFLRDSWRDYGRRRRI
jgi:hypothetical protein